MSNPKDHGPRRRLKSRDTAWARSLAKILCASGLSPNAISVLSILFAAGAFGCFWLAPDMTTPTRTALLWLSAVACIQLRLICNLMDGMVAVEGGKSSPTGPIYNEAPDRVADVLILVGAGYSTNVDPGVLKLFDAVPLGWFCAVLAMGTAYLRVLQGTLTGKQSFMGPMAKQHRMAVLTVGSLCAAVEQWLHTAHVAEAHIHGIRIALIVIAVGGVITCIRRLLLISQQMRHPAAD